MKRIIIKTCGSTGKKLYDILKTDYPEGNYEFLDNNANKWGTKVEGAQVHSLYEVSSMYKSGEVDKIIIPDKFYEKDEIKKLKKVGILEIDILIFSREAYEKGKNPFIQLEEFTALPYLEFHINDHCNLNCKGCSHFCPLVKEEKFTDYNQFEKDIKKLKELIPYIRTIRIMGGEPLLNKELNKFIRITRMCYPVSDIKLVTNGILIPSLSEDVWNCIKENDIEFDISAYPAVYNHVDEYVKIVKQHNVKLDLVSHISSFVPILHAKREIPFDNTKDCTCYNLHEGMVSSCPMTFYGKYYNDYFGKNIPFESGNINLYEEKLTGKELIEKLNIPFEFCKYCNQYMFGINNSERNIWDMYYKNEKKLEKDWY